MNPYASPAVASTSKPIRNATNVARHAIWVLASSLIVAFLVYPADPRLAPIHNSLGVAGFLLPFLPFCFYELLCRKSRDPRTWLAAILRTIGRCLLTYVAPFCICQFVIFQIYFYLSPLFWSQFGLHLTSHRPMAVTSFIFASSIAMLYDRRVSHRSVAPDGRMDAHNSR